jgi:hypothetical protein
MIFVQDFSIGANTEIAVHHLERELGFAVLGYDSGRVDFNILVQLGRDRPSLLKNS